MSAIDIDKLVLFSVLQEIGWTKIVLSPMTKEHGEEIDQWIINHVRGKTNNWGLVWLFEKSEDAMLFLLRWG